MSSRRGTICEMRTIVLRSKWVLLFVAVLVFDGLSWLNGGPAGPWGS